MFGPYREALAPEAPLNQIAWQRRMARASQWLFAFATIWGAVTVVGAVTNRHARFLSALNLGASIGFAAACWILTTRHPSARLHWLAWVVRAAAVAAPVAAALRRLGVPLQTLVVMSELLLAAAGLTYVGHLFSAAKRERDAETAWAAVVFWIIMIALYVTPARALREGDAVGYLCFWLWTGYALWRLRRAMEVVDCKWWFDAAGDAPGEWVTLLVHSDDRAEALSVDGPFAHFTSKDEAAEWLGQHGYVPAQRALEQELVRAAPPDLLAAKH